jgi:hypothetical protein
MIASEKLSAARLLKLRMQKNLAEAPTCRAANKGRYIDPQSPEGKRIAAEALERFHLAARKHGSMSWGFMIKG